MSAARRVRGCRTRRLSDLKFLLWVSRELLLAYQQVRCPTDTQSALLPPSVRWGQSGGQKHDGSRTDGFWSLELFCVGLWFCVERFSDETVWNSELECKSCSPHDVTPSLKLHQQTEFMDEMCLLYISSRVEASQRAEPNSFYLTSEFLIRMKKCCVFIWFQIIFL